MREITRIEAVAKSPILSFFSEIIRGIIYSRHCISKNYLLEVMLSIYIYAIFLNTHLYEF